ncbi:DUF4347 domain-containing protein, partial [Thalassospira xiamenensis]|uniref:DUF4347 domain-containing protein n=1 Tax=Thalassospira xiamenensis TaxID=220697 RepID=UPI001E567CB0
MPTSATRAGIKTQSVLHVQSLADVLPLALEPRYMFDAAGAATAAESAEQAQADSEAENATSGSADDTTSADGGDQESAALAAALSQASSTGFQEIRAADPSQNNGRKEAVLIDTSVADWQILANGVAPGKAIILLDGARDGVSAMAQWAEGNSGYDAIHLLSHGSEGQLHVGTATLTQESLTGRADELQMLGNALAEDGDLLLYGCDVAGGEGAAFVNALATLTGADIAASTDMTGTASLGGDWDLEAHFGTIDADDAGEFANYSGILETVSFNSGDVDNSGDGVTTRTFERTVDGQTLTFSYKYFYDLTGAAAGYYQAFDGSVGDGSNGTKLTMAIADGYSFDLTGFKYFTEQDDTITIEVTYADNSTATGTLLATENSAQTITDFSVFSGISTTSLNDIKSVVISSVNTGSNSGLGLNDIEVVDVKAIVSNTAPALGGTPADVTVTEDTPTAIDLSAYNVSDGEGDTITLTLAVDRGAIAGAAGTGITITNSGSGSMTLQGSAANLNTYLNDTTKITYTPASNDTTAATLTVTPNDGTIDGTADTVTINITAVNDAPTASGVPTDVTVTEDTISDFDLSAVTIADVDGDNLTVTIVVSAGTFATPVDGSGVGSGVTATLVNGTTITLAGSAADINTYLDTTSNIRYTGASNVSGDNAATFTINANDGTTNPQIGSGNIDITATNDAPTVTGVPTDVTVTEDTASDFDLSAVSFADIDGDSLTVTIAASAGTFAATSSGSVTVGGSGTGTLTLTGTAANINTWLDTTSNIQYTGASNAAGDNAATFTINANDGTVNPQVGGGNIDITGVDDAPTVTGVPTDVTVAEDTASNFDLSAVTFTEVDGQNLTVTIVATAGTFAATSSGSVTVGGSGTGTLTLTGTAANINTWLDTTSNIQYTGASNVSGDNAATFTVTANDGTTDSTVSNGNIDITATNDAPTVTGVPTDVTVTEDTASDFDLSAVSFADIDGDSLTVTIAASAGTFAATSSGSVT